MYIYACMGNSEKLYRWSYLKADMEIHLKKTNAWIPTGKRGWNELQGWHWHIYITDAMCNVDNEWEYTV